MPVAKILQYIEEDSNALTRRINQLEEIQESREQVNQNLIIYQEKMKSMFDRKEKDRYLQPGDLVLRCDVKRED